MKEFEDLLKDLKLSLETKELPTSEGGREYGVIEAVADGVVSITGLSGAGFGQVLDFDGISKGLVLSLKADYIEAVILRKNDLVARGTKVFLSEKELAFGVSANLAGRVISPLGEDLDGLGPIVPDQFYPLENKAPGIIDRQPVFQPLPTGILSVDSLTPVGLGQRELIIGDRATGKTTLALTAILNQKNQTEKVHCIYVTVSQKQSKVAQLVEKLRESGAMEYTTVIAAFPSDGPALSYLAPFAGCALGEYFRDKGTHALVVYDDLSKHAVAYRELSLLLKRPSGREAYPGDVFYLHSRLLERAAKLSEKNGGGSLTALPIVETQEGDVSAYVPTNVISITDGQIYLEADLFNAGVKPAINVGLSVSRVGGAAQGKLLKKVSGTLRLDLSQYRELAAFAQFGSDLDEKTKKSLRRGEIITKLLTQEEYKTYTTGEEVVTLLLIDLGFFDELTDEKIVNDHRRFLDLLEQEKSFRNLLETATELEAIKDELRTLWQNFIN